jgi:predicted nucleic acid-binding protein
MGYLIDTNILSELQKGERANVGVRTWYAETRTEDLYLLAATALEHGLTLVTRNIRDVERSGAALLNPFTDTGGP